MKSHTNMPKKFGGNVLVVAMNGRHPSIKETLTEQDVLHARIVYFRRVLTIYRQHNLKSF